MAKTNGATNTQKMIMIALAEGWRLRFTDKHGWCLFQQGRTRPFAQVAMSTVEKMTIAGWLTAGIATKELDFRPEKLLTHDGRRYAQRLLKQGWAENYEFNPYRGEHAFELSPTLGEYVAAAA
jgi:endonuclease YncB( thermonuclease family)